MTQEQIANLQVRRKSYKTVALAWLKIPHVDLFARSQNQWTIFDVVAFIRLSAQFQFWLKVISLTFYDKNLQN